MRLVLVPILLLASQLPAVAQSSTKCSAMTQFQSPGMTLEITRAAIKVGYRPLRYDGLNKVLLGLTTIEEIEENCSFELAE